MKQSDSRNLFWISELQGTHCPYLKKSFLIVLGFIAVPIGLMTSIFFIITLFLSFSTSPSETINSDLPNIFFCNEDDAKYQFKLFSITSYPCLVFLLFFWSWSPKISSILIFLAIDFRKPLFISFTRSLTFFIRRIVF